MGRSVRAFVAVALALGGVLVGVFGAPLNASAAPRRRPPPRPPAPVPTWTVDRVRVESVGAAASVVGVGTYPGVLDVVPAAAGAPRGLAVVNEVGFEEYVAGISEVPSEWPIEALKAQAVAARTYALWEMGRTTASEYRAVGAHTCASQACQVYTGTAKKMAPMGDRWAAAVEATRGEVLWWRDGPIVAKYSSSNGGQSVPGGQPYLRAVDDPDDAHSPLHRWRVTVPASALAAGLGLPGRRILRVERAGDAVAVTTVAQDHAPATPPTTDAGSATQAAADSDTGGTQTQATNTSSTTSPSTTNQTDDPPSQSSPATDPAASEPVTTTVPVVEFRERVNAAIAAPAHVPRTLPTVRFGTALVDNGQAVLFDGRGWGHGIGLSQWGAFGKARRGMKAPDILATYYAGLKPVRPPEPRLPASIKVAVATGRPAVDIEPPAGSKGRLRIVSGDGTVLAHAAAGRWTVRPAAGGGVQVTGPPAEHGSPSLTMGGTTPERPEAADPIAMRVRLGHDALVSVTATRPTGEQVTVGEPRRHAAGDLVLRLPAAGSAGTYAVTVHADRGGGRIASLDAPVTVTNARGANGRADRSGRAKAAVDRGRRAVAGSDDELTVSAAGAVGDGGFPGAPDTTTAVALVAALGATRSGARALGRRWLRRLH